LQKEKYKHDLCLVYRRIWEHPIIYLHEGVPSGILFFFLTFDEKLKKQAKNENLKVIQY